MNLENSYGTHESLLKAFQDALQQNEPFAVFQKLAAIYVKSQKFDVRNLERKVCDSHSELAIAVSWSVT